MRHFNKSKKAPPAANGKAKTKAFVSIDPATAAAQEKIRSILLKRASYKVNTHGSINFWTKAVTTVSD